MKANTHSLVHCLTSKISLACLLSTCCVGSAFAQKEQGSKLYFSEESNMVIGGEFTLPLMLDNGATKVASMDFVLELPEGVDLAYSVDLANLPSDKAQRDELLKKLKNNIDFAGADTRVDGVKDSPSDQEYHEVFVDPVVETVKTSMAGVAVPAKKTYKARTYKITVLSPKWGYTIKGESGKLFGLKLKSNTKIDALENADFSNLKINFSDVTISDNQAKRADHLLPKNIKEQNMFYQLSPVAGELSAVQSQISLINDGKARTVDFNFSNQLSKLRDFEFVVSLPTGVSLEAKNEVVLADRIKNHNVTFNKVANTANDYKFVVSSLAGSTVNVGNSVLFSLNLVADATFTAKDANVVVKDVVFAHEVLGTLKDNSSVKVAIKNLVVCKEAKERLDLEVAGIQQNFDKVQEDLFGVNGSCVNVKDQFTEQVAAIQTLIDAESAEIQKQYDAETLDESSTLNKANVDKINAEIALLQTNAQEALKNAAEANQAAKTRLDAEVKVYQDQLAAALASPYAPDPYYTDLAVADVKALADDVQVEFEAGKLNAGSKLNAEKETAVVNSLSKVNSDVLYNHCNALVNEVYNTQAVDELGFSQHVAQYNRAVQAYTKVQNDLARATNKQLVDVKFLEMSNRSIDNAEKSFLSFVNGAAGNKAAYEAEFKLGYDKSDLVNAEYVEANYITEDQETLSAERARLLAEYEKLVARHNAYLDVVTVQTLNGELDALRGQLKEFEAVAGILIKNHAEPKVTDANELVNYILEKKQLPSEVLELKRMMKRADLNSDGRLTTRDYNEIIKLVLGQH